MKSSEPKKLKICVACSTGGHLVEIKQLRSVYEKHDFFYFTFAGGVADELKKDERVRTIPNIVRHNPISWIVGAFMSFWHVLSEKPDVVLTTGAGVVVFYCIIARLLGAKLIFMESMAHVEKPTLTARMLYPFSHLFLVQWPQLLTVFPKARYAGRIF